MDIESPKKYLIGIDVGLNSVYQYGHRCHACA